MNTVKVFVDTDVVLDVLLKREPFCHKAHIIFDLAERGKVDACISSLIVANLYYIIRKYESGKKAIEVLKKLKLIFRILPVDEKVIELALMSGFHDFEDAIQYYVAVEHGMKFLVTRNETDYKGKQLDVCNPVKFVSLPIVNQMRSA